MEGAASGGPSLYLKLLQCSELAQPWRAAGAVSMKIGGAGEAVLNVQQGSTLVTESLRMARGAMNMPT